MRILNYSLIDILIISIVLFTVLVSFLLKWKKIAISVILISIFTILFVVFDKLLGTYGFTYLLELIVFIAFLVLILKRFFFTKSEKSREIEKKIILFLALFLVSLPVYFVLLRFGNIKSIENGDIIISTLNQYYSENEEYPKELELLKPDFIKIIPKPSIFMNSPGFKYTRLLKDRFTLEYYQIYNHACVYDSKFGEWYYHD